MMMTQLNDAVDANAQGDNANDVNISKMILVLIMMQDMMKMMMMM